MALPRPSNHFCNGLSLHPNLFRETFDSEFVQCFGYISSFVAQTCKCNAKSSLLSAGVRNPIDVELFTPRVEGEEIDDDLNSENNNT